MLAGPWRVEQEQLWHMVRFPERNHASAGWSRRLALFAIPVAALTTLLHRFGHIETPVALVLLGMALAMAGLALLLAVWALVSIWRNGGAGAASAVAGLFLSAALLAWPSWLLTGVVILPPVNDVTTDWQQPPPLTAAERDRAAWANPVDYPRAYVLPQATAYPEIVPFFLSYPAPLVHDAALLLVERRGWRVLATLPPADGAPGRIEAVARTLLFGFEDDVVVRIVPRGPEQTRVDMRSASRYGRHDLGENAARVYSFLEGLRDLLETDPEELRPLATEEETESG
jgi:hypothetical protein